jgi:hypothetical protein
MKKFLLFAACASTSLLNAQITINSNHLPNAGDLLFMQAATLQTDVDLEATGPNYNWNFGYDILQPGALDAGTECVDLGSLSLIDQLFFNNPFNPDYNSDFGIGAALLDNPIISIEDAYQIYKNSGGVYAMTGIVATVSGVPLNAQYDDRDIIYDLPLTYPASGNSHSTLTLDVPTIAYYGTDQYRDYVCDGWGTINIYDQSFDVLRVKSTLIGFDTISVNFNGAPFGFQIPKDITTYQWISTAFKVPVLEITSSAGGFGGAQLNVRTADLGTSSISHYQSELNIYPNPTSDALRIVDADVDALFTISSAEGKFIKRVTATQGIIDVNDLSAGLYLLQSTEGGIIRQTRFVKQ